MTTSEPIVLTDEPEAPEAPIKYDEVVNRLMARISKPEVVSTKLKVLIYAEPGVGKTTFVGTSPSCLLVDIERGAKTLAGNSQVDVMEYVSIEQIERLVDYLVDGHSAFDKYDTVAFDSLSEMQRRVLDQQLGSASKAIGAPVYKADWGLWGENTQRLRALMSKFRDVNKNLIVTAHAKQDKDDATGIMMFRPDLTPKLSATVSGMFDIVGYMKINSKGERILQVQPSKTVLAKTRVTTLPKEIVNPNWGSLNK